MKTTLVVGGPGAGKTAALLSILEDRLKRYDPDQIAFLAFTRKAANEARARSASMLGLAEDDMIYFRTIHSLCYQALGLDRALVMNKADYKELGDALGLECGAPDDDFGLPLGTSEGETLARLEQLCRVTGLRLDDVAPRQGVDYWAALHYAESLTAYKREKGLYDFTDMIEQFIALDPLGKIPIVVIDEAQDLSPIHWRAMRALIQRADETFIGGDDDQAIFRWAGASVRQFLDIDGHREILPVSHRLPRAVYGIGSKIVHGIGRRIAKDWTPSDREGAVGYVDHVEDFDYLGDTWFLLARHGFQLAQYVSALRRIGIPYNYRGESSTNTGDVKLIYAWEDLRKGKAIRMSVFKRIVAKLPNALFPQDHVRGLARFDGWETVTKGRAEELGLTGCPPWFDAMVITDADYYRECLRTLQGTRRKLTDPPNVTVSTIHGVKGGEADHVVLIPDMARAAYQAYMRNYDDEARVFYVGATRARESLSIVHPRSNKYFQL